MSTPRKTPSPKKTSDTSEKEAGDNKEPDPQPSTSAGESLDIASSSEGPMNQFGDVMDTGEPAVKKTRTEESLMSEHESLVEYEVRSALPKENPMADEFEIVRITMEDKERVLEMLRRFFFKDEPLNKDVELLGKDGNDTCKELEEFSTSSISEGLSLIAVSQAGEIVGVCINGAHYRGEDSDTENKEETCGNPKFIKILKLLSHIDKEADVFSKFPGIDKMLETKVLSVDSSFRGKGIATLLMKKTRQIGKDKGFPMYRVDCSSHFSACAAASLGMQCIYTMKYKDYTENGKPIFQPASPHTEAKIFVQRL